MFSISRTSKRASLLALLSLVTLGLGLGCGAKTGLLIPDASVDAEVEADVEMEADVDVDADVCEPDPVPIDRRRAEVMFALDRSASMLWALEGSVPITGEPTRWELLRDSLADVLDDTEHLLEYGAKFFPLEVRPGVDVDPVTACTINTGIDLAPAPNNRADLLRIFDRTVPNGGTPTAPALRAARDSLVANTREGVAQFVVLATDGGPNCNEDAEALGCICTGPAEFCEEPSGGYFNCLDSERTIDIITSIYGEHGIPVFVIGIDDPLRPDLADFLDEMAITGGRPRSITGERRFYSVHREGQLQDALATITGSIARCIFTVNPMFATDPRLQISVDGEVVPYDADQLEGWAWTAQDEGELTIFGSHCDRASLPGLQVTAELVCLDE